MGYKVSYAAFRNIDKCELLSRLKLVDTKIPDPDNESVFSGGDLGDGWLLVWSNSFEWGLTRDLFLKLSLDADVLVVSVHETTMTFMSTSYIGGRVAWEISHNAQVSD